MKLSTAASIRDVDPEEWAPLAAGLCPYVGHAYLAGLESPDTPVTYVLARDGAGALVGALPAYLWSGDGQTMRHYDPHLTLTPARVRAVMDRDAWFPLLLAGTRANYRNELLLHPSRRGDRELVTALLEAALDLAGELGAAAAALMFLSPEAARDLLPALPPAMSLLLTSADTRLDVPWTDFDGYLAHLSHNRRQSARRERAAFAAAGFELTTCRLSACCEVIAPLLANLQRRHGIELSEAEVRAYLRSQLDAMDEVSTVTLCHRRGRPAAFAACYESQGTLYGRMAGFDYALVEGTAAYFNLAFYLPIRHAIERGLRSVTWGPTAWKAKVMRGAALEPLWSAVAPPAAVADRWRRSTAGWNSAGLRWWRERFGPLGAELPAAVWTRVGLAG